MQEDLRNAIYELLQAVEEIENTWEQGDLADAVNQLVATKDEVSLLMPDA